MKLKTEVVNGYLVLVDEDAEIKDGDWFFLDMTDNNLPNELHQMGPNKKSKTGGINFYHNTAWTNCCSKIIFAEPELKLEGVPVFEWRDFDEDEIAESVLRKQNWDTTITLPFNQGFIQGYKSNPAKYTESDLEDLLIAYNKARDNDEHFFIDEYIQSLQKYPKWVVMESEYFKVNGMIDEASSIRSKLFTNSEGKQEGTVKELIWE